MKQKVFILLVACMAICTFVKMNSNKNANMEQLFAANVEALADAEIAPCYCVLSPTVCTDAGNGIMLYGYIVCN